MALIRTILRCQIFADAMNVLVRQPEAPIAANAAGSAFIAGVGLGEYSFHDVSTLTRSRTVYHPSPAHRQIYDELYGAFTDAYRSLAPFYRRLNLKNKELLK